MSTYGKKHVVLTPEIYKSLVARQQKLRDPRAEHMMQLDQSTKNVWDRNDINQEQKIEIFNNDLYNLRRFKTEQQHPKIKNILKMEKDMRNILTRDDLTAQQQNELYTKALYDLNRYKAERDLPYIPSTPHDQPKVEEQTEHSLDVIPSALVSALPKTLKPKGKMLLDRMKNNKEIISWNPMGEVIYKGDKIAGSNIIDLFSMTVNAKSKAKHIPLFHKTIFGKALSELNTPRDWIKNDEMFKIMEEQQEQDLKSDSEEKFHDNDNDDDESWLSSTSYDSKPEQRETNKDFGEPWLSSTSYDNRPMEKQDTNEPPKKKAWLSSTSYKDRPLKST